MQTLHTGQDLYAPKQTSNILFKRKHFFTIYENLGRLFNQNMVQINFFIRETQSNKY